MGVYYDEGEGVRKDPDEAARWYQRAVDLGDPDGHLNLGRVLKARHQLAEARTLIRTAAERG